MSLLPLSRVTLCPLLLSLTLLLPLQIGRAQGRELSTRTFSEFHSLDGVDLSTDGRRLAYTVWTRDSTSDGWTPRIWTSAADGAKAAMLTEGRDPRWSPDGRQMAWVAPVDGHWQLLVQDLQSGELRQLTRGAGGVEEPDWSPDGSALAFIRWLSDSITNAADPGDPAQRYLAQRRGLQVRRHLFLVPLQGGEPRDLTPGGLDLVRADLAAGSDRSWSWFPDGRNLAFAANDSPDAAWQYRRSAIWFVPVDGGSPGRLSSTPGFWHSPLVSPDGRWVAYSGSPDTPGEYHAEDLYVMLPDGSGVRNLTAGLERDPAGARWADERTLWFSVVEAGSINIFSASLTAGVGARAITNGNHSLVLADLTSKSGGFAVAVRSGVVTAPELVRLSLKKPSQMQEISSLHQELIRQLSLGEVEDLFLSVEGSPLQGQLFRPPVFELGARYPLVVELGPGPHSAVVAGFDPGALWLAGQGYLVLRLNPRGSTGEGDLFASAAEYPVSAATDVMAALDQVVNSGAVDTGRVFLHGCGAGAITALHLLTTSKRFSRASLACTGGDWLGQGAAPPLPRPGPFFLRRLSLDPLVWAEQSPLRFASLVTIPVLIQAGACDLLAPFGIAGSLHQALRLRGVASRLTSSSTCRISGEEPGMLEERREWYTGKRVEGRE